MAGESSTPADKLLGVIYALIAAFAAVTVVALLLANGGILGAGWRYLIVAQPEFFWYGKTHITSGVNHE